MSLVVLFWKNKNMRREKAKKLIRDWANKLCIHPHKEDEYFLGKATGNLVCTICGKTFGKKSTLDNIGKLISKEIKRKFQM
jgi:hypothetical protein